MKINTTLKLLRKQKGLTQEEIAQLLGVGLSSYQKYERNKGNVTPSIEVLVKISDFYGVTIDYLLGRESKQEPAIDYAEVKKKTDALIERIENLPPEYQDVMDKIIHMLYDVEQKAQPPEIQQSKMVAVETAGEFRERQKHEAEAEAEAQRKETA